jgi:hypothetical protein
MEGAAVGLKIATWNLERPRPSSYVKNPQIIEELRRIGADILVLTETSSVIDLGSEYSHSLASVPLPVSQYSGAGENRTTIWSKSSIKKLKTYDSSVSVCGGIQTEYGNLAVYGTVIGIQGNREKSFLPHLEKQIADWERIGKSSDICIAGDFNISFCDPYYYTKTGRALISESFAKLQIKNLTAEITENIDHIAISDAFVKNAKCKNYEWNKEKKLRVPRLSDHKGVCISLEYPKS